MSDYPRHKGPPPPPWEPGAPEAVARQPRRYNGGPFYPGTPWSVIHEAQRTGRVVKDTNPNEAPARVRR